MWVERVIRSGFEPTGESAERSVDYLDLQWDACRRVVKGTTRGGEPVRVLLPAGEMVRHGDVLHEDAAGLVVVNVLPCEVVVVRPSTVQQAAEVGLQLGNLHHPTQVSGGEVIFISDEIAMGFIRAAGVAWTIEPRVFEPAAVDVGVTLQVTSGFQVVRPEPD